ncbi:S10 family peptidase [Alteromonas aestuariivivens]|nr:serine carboxypeptidase [Alteromonas aestuariivivens]
MANEHESDPSLPIPEEQSFVTSHTGKFGGRKLDYSAEVSNMLLKDSEGGVYASVVTTAYLAKEKQANRPVTFVFNGGPGSSSVWLHMGMVGPKRVVVPSDAQDAGNAPYQMVDNEYSILDVTDIVLIDPVGTGFSKLAGKGTAEDVWGLKEDAKTTATVIREWIRKNKRWNSPKYVLGESFGTTRSAAMLPYLHNREEPIRLNGIIMVSQALDFTGSTPWTPHNMLAYVTYLPSMSATAWYHNKLADRPASLTEHLEEVRSFAVNEYLPALFKGSRLPAAEFNQVASKLAGYLGLDVNYVKRANLRVQANRFEKQLLREEGLSTGNFDSRYTTNETDDLAVTTRYDAASAAVSAAYTAALNDYLHNDLGVSWLQPYIVSSSEVGDNWVWHRGSHSEPQFVHAASYLAEGMSKNPALKVMVASGYYDYSTPFFDAEFTFGRHGIDMSRVTMTYYESGHMMYLHHPSLQKLAEDTRAFYLVK